MIDTMERTGNRINGGEAVHVPATQRPASEKRDRAGVLNKNRTLVNFWLDAALLVNFIALIWVSVIVQFVFPPPEHSGGYTIWGLGLSQFMSIQFATLCVFVLGVVVHLMLHWSWVCGVVGNRLWRRRDGSRSLTDDGQRTIFGVGLMIVLLNVMGLGIAWAAIALQAPY